MAGPSIAEELAILADRHGHRLCVLFGLLFLLQSLATSVVKPFWLDEWFTASFARLEEPAAIVNAVRNAADPIPPAFYLIEGVFHRLIPVERVALRLPGAIGTAGAMACVYALLRPSVGALSALAGAALLFITAAFGTYCSEARPYGLLLGCFAGAALAWKTAHRSWLRAAVFGGCLTLGAALHYYGVFTILAFLAAEAWLWFRLKRFRPAVFLFFGVAFTPLLLQWPFLSETRRAFGPNFWARPYPGAVEVVYQQLFPGLWIGVPLWSLLLLPGVFASRRTRTERPGTGLADPSSAGSDPLERQAGMILAVSLSLLLPAMALFLTWLAQGGFAPRYILPMVIGAAISFGYCCATMPAFPRLLILLILGVSGGVQCALTLQKAWLALTTRPPAMAERNLQMLGIPLEKNPFPLAVSSGSQFLELALESQAKWRQLLLFVADPKHAAQLTGFDSVDVGLQRLRTLLGLNVQDYQSFRRQHRRFYLLARGDRSEWLVPVLLRDGCGLRLLGVQGASRIYWSECEAWPR